jgi:uncharacterized protein YbcI
MIEVAAGRGPTPVRTTVYTNVIVVVLEDALTSAERTLAASGEAGTVQIDRAARLGALMRADAVELVEQISGRTVVGSISAIDVDANVAAVVFAPERRRETGFVETGEFSGS